MRKVMVALLCAIVAGLMMVPSGVSAGSKTVYFTDRQGDLGKTWYTAGTGIHVYGDPLSWYSGNCPVSNAGYLDMLSGWVTVKSGDVTMGLKVDSPLPLTTDSKLPEGITEVRWVWIFYPNTEQLTWDYGVFILWDGAHFSAVLVDRTSGSPPFIVTPLDNFNVEGTVLTVTMSLASIPGMTAWWSEILIMHGSPWPLDQWPSSGAWQATDITDYQLPISTYWPCQPMP